MELRLMFHTMWTNSGCHGYHSLEFPVSWVIKFPTVILLYWFVSVTPYFLGLISLRTFHRLLGSPQAFAFCTPVSGGIECFSQGVCSSRKPHGVKPPGALWVPGSAELTQLVEVCAAGNPQPHWAAHSGQHLYSFSIAFLPPCCPCAVQCFMSCLQEMWRTAFSVLPRSLLLVTARVSGQPACWNSHEECQQESDGLWEFLSLVLQ